MSTNRTPKVQSIIIHVKVHETCGILIYSTCLPVQRNRGLEVYSTSSQIFEFHSTANDNNSKAAVLVLLTDLLSPLLTATHQTRYRTSHYCSDSSMMTIHV